MLNKSVFRVTMFVCFVAISLTVGASVSALNSRNSSGVVNADTLAAATAPGEVSLPLRAAFYYPWFPEAWTQLGINPYTKYNPSLGFYDSGDAAVIRAHISAMQYGNINAGISSWWGQGTRTDVRLPGILSASADTGFKWSIYYEPEGQGDPSVSQLNADLVYVRDHYASDPGYLRLGGKFVVFVYGAVPDGCATADRWKQANTVNAYVVLKVFSGYKSCANQPDGWHQYAPAVAASRQGTYAYSISPGFDKVGEAARLTRDLTRWKQNIRDMIASGATFQLVTTFDEWGEGTAVESASQWSSASGYGSYLDALHFNGEDPQVFAAGDIASCTSTGDEATSDLLLGTTGTVITLGDNAYESGTPAEFSGCYDPSWGRVLPQTRPATGNHEYLTPGAAGYFGYFGAAAGDPTMGYYSYDVGTWHLVVINSNCSVVGGCSSGSPQEQWLRADLAAHPATCTLAYWHHPRFSSGEHGNQTSMQPIWQALYDAGADVVLSGHDHDYERFSPQTPDGTADPARGIREFVAGTGGRNHYVTGTPIANSEVHDATTFGVLRMTLHPTSYDWQFLPEAGQTFTDSGTSSCHTPSVDTDGDGFNDDQSFSQSHINTNINEDNCPGVPNPSQLNTDGNFVDLPASFSFNDLTNPRSDALGDACDADSDNDGLSNAVEAASHPCASASGPTDPLKNDTDGDEVLDAAECALGSDPTNAASEPANPNLANDPDNDGLSTAFETTIGTNPYVFDTDGDGLRDGLEYKAYNSNPLILDSDGDGCGDAIEVLSVDGNKVVNANDLATVAGQFNLPIPPSTAAFDIDKNGIVNANDLAMIASALNASCL